MVDTGRGVREFELSWREEILKLSPIKEAFFSG
jgi:hypothetical protein